MLTESQKRLLQDLQAPVDAPTPLASRAERLEECRSTLKLLNEAGDAARLEADYADWRSVAEGFETTEMVEVVEMVYASARRAREQGRAFNFSGQIAYSVMVWADGVLSDMENLPPDPLAAGVTEVLSSLATGLDFSSSASRHPEWPRYLLLFDNAYRLAAAWTQHATALREEDAEPGY